MAVLAFGGAEALGIGIGSSIAAMGVAHAIHSAPAIDLSYHGWTDMGATSAYGSATTHAITPIDLPIFQSASAHSAPIDLSYHSWTDSLLPPPYHPPGPNVDIHEWGHQVLPPQPLPKESDVGYINPQPPKIGDLSDPYGNHVHTQYDILPTKPIKVTVPSPYKTPNIPPGKITVPPKPANGNVAPISNGNLMKTDFSALGKDSSIHSELVAAGNSKVFGAALQTQVPLKIGGQEVTPGAYLTVGGPYGHVQPTSGGLTIGVAIK